MRAPYERLTQSADIPRRLRDLSARTVVVDVEPLVAFWDTDQQTLTRGVVRIIAQITAVADHVQVVAFATNSTRQLPAPPVHDGLHVHYLASAAKPLRTAPYRDLPRPGVVIGDQVATDGVLAWRLGYTFLHYCPNLPNVPRGPHLMNLLGQPIRKLLFLTK